MPSPATRPACSKLLVDLDGFVWAVEFLTATEQDQPVDSEVFSPEGEWLGTVRLPARFTPFEIGTDYVLGRRFDNLDVEHIQLLRLSRRDPSS